MKIVSIKPYQGWLNNRFGENYARISTNQMLRLKSSIKDVHRAFHGYVSPEIEALTKKMPIPPMGITDYDFVFGYRDSDKNWVKGAIETDPTIKTYVETYPKEWAVVTKCLGLTRVKSQHACGWVIASEPIKNFIPLMAVEETAVDDEDKKNKKEKKEKIVQYVTQYVAEDVEGAGGLKMDFLSVNSLKDLSSAIKLIQQRNGYTPKTENLGEGSVPGMRVVPHKGKLYDIWNLPEDQKVFAEICSGRTDTVFQVGTASAKKWLREFMGEKGHAIKSIEDLAAFTALDRPGPLDYYVESEGVKRNMLQEFAARSRGEEPIGNNPLLDKMLPETKGVITYQEQLQKVFQELGNTTGIQANQFRDDISKKRMEKVMQWKQVFMPNAIKVLGKDEAERLWDSIETFGQYGFNKSHAVCYAITGYACAWLKYYYPLEWWTAVLINEKNKKKIEEEFWPYCGSLVLAPDISLSSENFEIQGDKIRAPLRLLEGVGPAAHEELCAERPYRDINEFCSKLHQRKVHAAELDKNGKLKLGRSSISKTIVAKLIVSGVADSLFPPETSIYDKFDMYPEAVRLAKGLPKIKKADLLDSRFAQLEPIQRFQLKKDILPTFGSGLTDIVKRLNPLPKFLIENGGNLYLKTSRRFRSAYSEEGENLFQCLGGYDLNLILSGLVQSFPPTKTAAIVYINDVKRWTYGIKKREACKIFFEVDGYRFNLVKWSRTIDGKDVLQVPEELKSGCVAALSFVQFNEGRDFSVDDIEIIQDPLDLKEKKEQSDE